MSEIKFPAVHLSNLLYRVKRGWKPDVFWIRGLRDGGGTMHTYAQRSMGSHNPFYFLG